MDDLSNIHTKPDVASYAAIAASVLRRSNICLVDFLSEDCTYLWEVIITAASHCKYIAVIMCEEAVKTHCDCPL